MNKNLYIFLAVSMIVLGIVSTIKLCIAPISINSSYELGILCGKILTCLSFYAIGFSIYKMRIKRSID